jgi:hypothetical protein
MVIGSRNRNFQTAPSPPQNLPNRPRRKKPFPPSIFSPLSFPASYVIIAEEWTAHSAGFLWWGTAPACSNIEMLGFKKVGSSGEFVEVFVIAMIDAIMGTAVELFQTSKRFATSKNEFSIG